MAYIKNKFLLLGIICVISGIVAGVFYIDTGCGVCGGYELQIRPAFTTSFQYIPSMSNTSPAACSLMGCTPGPMLPLFMDIYILGTMFIVVGIKKRRK